MAATTRCPCPISFCSPHGAKRNAGTLTPHYAGAPCGLRYLAHRKRRKRIDVGHHVDDRRPPGRKRAFECSRELAWLLDPDAERPHVLRQPRKVGLVVGPQLARLLGLLAPIGAVEAAFRLIAAAVVVDDRDGVNLPAYRRLDLGHVVPEPRIAGERHDRPPRRRAFGAEPGWKCPAEVAGAAQIALPRA